jgi:hypothetical protein
MSNPKTRYSKTVLFVWLVVSAIILIVYSVENQTAFPALPIFVTAILLTIIIIIIQSSEDRLEITVKGFHPDKRQVTFIINGSGNAYLELIRDEDINPRSDDKLTLQYIKNLNLWKIVRLSRRSFP